VVPACLNAQSSPTAPAMNFNAFIQQNVKMTQSEMEGPLAVGNNLIIAGDYTVSAQNVGTFTYGGLPVSLVVNGAVQFNSGNSFKVNMDGYAKIANCGTSKVWYQNQNNAYSPIRITPNNDYNSSP